MAAERGVEASLGVLPAEPLHQNAHLHVADGERVDVGLARLVGEVVFFAIGVGFDPRVAPGFARLDLDPVVDGEVVPQVVPHEGDAQIQIRPLGEPPAEVERKAREIEHAAIVEALEVAVLREADVGRVAIQELTGAVLVVDAESQFDPALTHDQRTLNDTLFDVRLGGVVLEDIGRRRQGDDQEPRHKEAGSHPSHHRVRAFLAYAVEPYGFQSRAMKAAAPFAVKVNGAEPQPVSAGVKSRSSASLP